MRLCSLPSEWILSWQESTEQLARFPLWGVSDGHLERVAALSDAIVHLLKDYRHRTPSNPTPSFRYNPIVNRATLDNSIFPGLVAIRVADGLADQLPKNLERAIEILRSDLETILPKHQNRSGKIQYNFWSLERSSNHFPNGWFFKHFKKFKLPDDADTTSNAFLAIPHSSSQALEFLAALQSHANTVHAKCHSSLPVYNDKKTFNTWLGTPAMPVDLDICILANILAFMERYSLPFDERANAALDMMEMVLRRGHFKTHALRVSPSYAEWSKILYHLARFSHTSIRHLGELPALIATAIESATRDDLDPYEKILTGSASVWAGSDAKPVQGGKKLLENLELAPFYIADLLVYSRLARPLAGTTATQIWFGSPVLNLCLLMEFEILARSVRR